LLIIQKFKSKALNVLIVAVKILVRDLDVIMHGFLGVGVEIYVRE